jgi:hypothetical protein
LHAKKKRKRTRKERRDEWKQSEGKENGVGGKRSMRRSEGEKMEEEERRRSY